MKPKIILAGGCGFLGSVLADYFSAKGMEVVIFTRKPSQRADATREVRWDGESAGEWVKELEGARALINLAGISVNCRYHARNRRRMLDSRLNSTRVLGEAVARCANPPPVWLNSSTATIYKHNFGPAWEETGEIGGCHEAKDIFSVHIATEWERVFNEANTPRTRKVALRSAMVLGHAKNSVLPNLLRLGRLGLGGSLAGGRQFISWIHEEDYCRAVEWIIKHENLSGAVNLAAPNPVTNAEFMAAVLTNGKGFYDPLVYVLECHRLGIPLLPRIITEPWVVSTLITPIALPRASKGTHSSELIPGTLVQRYKRFLADVRLSTGEIVTAHCTNTGSMQGCNEPGSAVYLSRSESKGRKLAYTWEMIEIQRNWVGINTFHPNRLAAEAIDLGLQNMQDAVHHFDPTLCTHFFKQVRGIGQVSDENCHITTSPLDQRNLDGGRRRVTLRREARDRRDPLDHRKAVRERLDVLLQPPV